MLLKLTQLALTTSYCIFIIFKECCKHLKSVWDCWLSLFECVKISTLKRSLPVLLVHSLIKMWCIHKHTHLEQGMFLQ